MLCVMMWTCWVMGLHSALVQCYSRKREHWDIIRWLMDNTQLRDNPLVLRRAFVEACAVNKLEEVRWMLQYREACSGYKNNR
jgi:hypothetical protein